jgi:phosphopantothenoylcysteine decarboxylase / phosphopantothenate---cysteine ligase
MTVARHTAKPCERLLVGISGSVHAVQVLDYLVPFQQTFADDIKVIMTDMASEMISPKIVQLVASEVHTDLWGNSQTTSPHIKLADWAQLMIVVPASADLLGKAANGIACDLLTTTLLAVEAPIVMAPAMNPRMWRNHAVRRNVATLRAAGIAVVEPEEGESLTTGRFDVGLGPTPEKVLAYAWHHRMKTLKLEYWESATATKPRTPADSVRPIAIRPARDAPAAEGNVAVQAS